MFRNWHFSTSKHQRHWYSSNISDEINQILQKMSQLPKHNVIAKKRQAAMARKPKVGHPPGKISVQVIGTGAPGAPASVYLFSDQKRYVEVFHHHSMTLNHHPCLCI